MILIVSINFKRLIVGSLAVLLCKIAVEPSKRSASVGHFHHDRHEIATTSDCHIYFTQIPTEGSKKIFLRGTEAPIHLQAVTATVRGATTCRDVEVDQLEGIADAIQAS